jgi:hypothetical protein
MFSQDAWISARQIDQLAERFLESCERLVRSLEVAFVRVNEKCEREEPLPQQRARQRACTRLEPEAAPTMVGIALSPEIAENTLNVLGCRQRVSGLEAQAARGAR